jgi:hypothetical protein
MNKTDVYVVKFCAADEFEAMLATMAEKFFRLHSFQTYTEPVPIRGHDLIVRKFVAVFLEER